MSGQVVKAEKTCKLDSTDVGLAVSVNLMPLQTKVTRSRDHSLCVAQANSSLSPALMSWEDMQEHYSPCSTVSY